MSNCTICNSELTGNYCSNCGQKIGKKETTLLSVIKELFLIILDVEKSVPAGIITMIRSPRRLIENYWAGHRKYYPSPGRFLIYALALAAIHLAYIDDQVLGAAISSEMIESQVLFWIVFFPTLSLTSYVSFLWEKQSFTKHVISILYVATTLFIVLLIINDILILTLWDPLNERMLFIFLLMVFVYNAIVFESRRGVGFILLGVLLQIISFAVVLVSIFLLLIYLFPFQSSITVD